MKKVFAILVIFILLTSPVVLAASGQNWSQEWDFQPGLFFSNGLKGSFSATIAEYLNGSDSTIGRIFGYLSIIFLVARMVCLGVMLVMGMIYMFSGPEKRADLKNRSIALFIGLIVIFGATYVMSTVIRFVDSNL